VAQVINNYPYSGEPVRLPIVGADDGTWGEILNNFLTSSLTSTGFLTYISTPSSSTYYIDNTTTGNSVGETVLANASSAAMTIYLPTTASNGNFYTIKKTDSSTNWVTVSAASGQYIDGGSTAVIEIQYASITVVSDGSSNWYII
jgi:hypothetical protein